MGDFLYLTSESKTDQGVVKDTVLPELGIEQGTHGQGPVRHPPSHD